MLSNYCLDWLGIFNYEWIILELLICCPNFITSSLIIFDSLCIVIIGLNCGVCPLVRVLIYGVGWVDFGLKLWGWNQWYVDLTFSIFCSLVHRWWWCLIWSTYGGGAMCFTCEWCGLIGATLCVMMIMFLSPSTWYAMMICVVDLCEVWSYSYTWVFLLLLVLGDHVKIWLCPYVCSLRVDACFLLIGYVSLVMIIMIIISYYIGWPKVNLVVHMCYLKDMLYVIKWCIYVSLLGRIKYLFLMH